MHKKMARGIHLYLFFFLCIIFVADASIASRYLPLNFGWWEYYAYLEEKGLILYKDISLQFPPLHIKIVGLLTKIAGGNIHTEAQIGILYHLLSFAPVFFWLNNRFRVRATYYGLVLCYLMGFYYDRTYIVRDYQTTVFLLSGMVFYLFSIEEKCTARPLLLSFLIGFFCALLALTKQNLGLILMATSILWWVIKYSIYSLRLHATIIVSLFGFSLPVFLSIYQYGEFFLKCVLGADGKGSPDAFLIRFITDKDIRLDLFISLAIVATYYILKYIINLSGEKQRIFSIQGAIGIPVLCLLLMAKFDIQRSVIIFSLSGLAYDFIKNYISLQRSRTVRYEPILMLALTYGATNAAGLSISNMMIPVSYYFVRYIKVYLKIYRLREIPLAIIASLIFSLSLKLRSAQPLYNWWGVNQGSRAASIYKPAGEELEGFLVDSNQESIYKNINSYKDDVLRNKSIFAYPNIPFVYMILNATMLTDTPVYWFDVTSEKKGVEAIQILDRSPPDIIFWYKPAQEAYIEHFKLRKTNDAMTLIDKWIIDSFISGDYRIESIDRSISLDPLDIYAGGSKRVADIFFNQSHHSITDTLGCMIKGQSSLMIDAECINETSMDRFAKTNKLIRLNNKDATLYILRKNH